MRTEKPWERAKDLLQHGYRGYHDCDFTYVGRPTGTSVVYDITRVYDVTGSAMFSGLDEYINTGYSSESDTWRCGYCGTSHWIENKELQCQKCGAPRDV